MESIKVAYVMKNFEILDKYEISFNYFLNLLYISNFVIHIIFKINDLYIR